MIGHGGASDEFPGDLETIVRATGDVFYVIRMAPDRAVEFISPSIMAAVGYSPEEHYADPSLPMRVVDPRDTATLEEMFGTPVGAPFTAELRLRHRDGRVRWTLHRGQARRRDDGSVVAEGSARDITVQHEAQEALAASEAEFRLLTEHVTDVVVRTGVDHVIEYVSPSVSPVFGWEPAELVGHRAEEFWHPDDLPRVAAVVLGATGGAPFRFRTRTRCKDGHYRWVEVLGRSLGGPTASLGITTVRDVDAQVRAEAALAASERLFRLAMLEAPQGMAILDLECRFLEVNPAMCELLDRSEEWLVAHSLDDVMDPDQVPADLLPRQALLDGDIEHDSAERRFIRPDGTVVWGQRSTGLLRGADGNPMSYVMQVQDMTTVHTTVAELEYQASHDLLTGLLNRRQLTDQLAVRLQHSPRSGRYLAVLYCDVDNFKDINDYLGHSAGDTVLTAIAERIARAVRTTDTVARVGGDEFVVVLDGVNDTSEAWLRAQAIRAATAGPIVHGSTTIHATVSMGVTLPRVGDGVDETLRDADLALYRAKQAGRDRVALFRGEVPAPRAPSTGPTVPVPVTEPGS